MSVNTLLTALVWILDRVTDLFIILVFLNVFLPYFLPVTNRVREFVDRLIDPLLRLIRRYIPPLGRFDFSPLVLLILVQLASSLLRALLIGLMTSG